MQTIHDRIEREDKMTKEKAVIIDLEGTLSNHNHRLIHYTNKDYNEYNRLFVHDSVNEELVEEIKSCVEKTDVKIILCTAKEHCYESEVFDWLIKHNITFIQEFLFRNTGDKRSSVEVKEEMLRSLQEKNYEIVMAYDDREDICLMYRANGVPCIQIGKPKFIGTCKSNTITVPEILKNSADLFESRNPVYGSSYKQFGNIVDALFPDGIELNTIDDFNRWGVFHMMLSKVNRYATNFKSGGHKDSLDDLITYSAMLQELDNEL